MWKIRVVFIMAMATLMLSVSSLAFALSLDEAKAKGLVGEKPSGYLGAVTSSGEVQALVTDINGKRRKAYEEIAKRNGTALSAVEALAGQKAIQTTKTGNYIEGPGGWTKK